jgi:hypothetical protein
VEKPQGVLPREQPPARHHGQRAHAGVAGERAVDGRIGVRDADERRGGKTGFRRYATKRGRCLQRTTAKLLEGLVGAAGFEPTTSTV